VRRAGIALEEARKAFTRAVNVEQRSSFEVQRLEALHREELGRLERLLKEEAEQKEEEEVVVTPRPTLCGSRFRPAAPLPVGGC
jgi:hypothetical protein